MVTSYPLPLAEADRDAFLAALPDKDTYGLRVDNPDNFRFVLPPLTVLRAVRDAVVTETARGDVKSLDDPISLVCVHQAGVQNYVDTRDDDGVKISYSHVLPRVEPGAKIKVGDPIGLVGGYTRDQGPHAHISFSKKETPSPIATFEGLEELVRDRTKSSFASFLQHRKNGLQLFGGLSTGSGLGMALTALPVLSEEMIRMAQPFYVLGLVTFFPTLCYLAYQYRSTRQELQRVELALNQTITT